MRGRYFFVFRQIGNRSRHAQYSLVRPGRQIEALRRALEQSPALATEITGIVKHAAIELCIGNARALELGPPRPLHPRRHRRTALRPGFAVAQGLR